MENKYYGVLNSVIVIVLILLFNIFCFLYMLKIKNSIGREPLFERSEHLLIFGTVANFIQSILNILYGVWVFLLDGKDIKIDIAFYITATFTTRVYASSMGLRIFKMQRLSFLRQGCTINTHKFLFSSNFNLAIISTYAFIITILYIIIYYFWDRIFASVYMIQFLYSIESVIFLLFSYISFPTAKHPSIPTEYIFYSFIWITGVVNNNVDRKFFIIPIRNSLLLLISVISLHAHADNIRPPFPVDLTLKNVYEIKEVYDNFKGFLEKNGNELEKEAGELYKNLKLAEHTGSEDAVVKAVHRTMCSLVINKDNSICDMDIYDALGYLEGILYNVYDEYMGSKELKVLRREYFINFC